MFSFSGWSTWHFVALAFVLLPKWSNCIDNPSRKGYEKFSLKLRLVDVLVRTGFAVFILNYRIETGWSHDGWFSIALIAVFAAVSGQVFRMIARLRFDSESFGDRFAQALDSELYALVWIARLVAPAALFGIWHASWGSAKNEFAKTIVPTVSAEGVTRALLYPAILRETEHESGVYTYAFVCGSPELTIFRYLSPERVPLLSPTEPKNDIFGRVIVYYRASNTELGINEVIKVEPFVLPEHAP